MADKQSRESVEGMNYEKETVCGVSSSMRSDATGGTSNASDLTVKVNVDVSEAITGLKAIQREAKEATKVLRELETYYEENGKRFYTKWKQSEDDECTDISEVCMSDIPTKYLHRELAKRDGVEGAGLKKDPATGFSIPPSTHQIPDIYKSYELTGVPTYALCDEIAKRAGVFEHTVAPHGEHGELYIRNANSGETRHIDGPARILIVQD